MPELDASTADWLVSTAGLDAVARTTERLDAGATELRIGERLRAELADPARSAAVMDASVARRRARASWTDADDLLFTRETLEQASDPTVSHWRARRFVAATHVVDACAGAGGDTLALGAATEIVTAIELDPARSRLLAHNVRAGGIHAVTVQGDALRVPAPAGAWVHADPARRTGTRRLRTLRELRPPVPALVGRYRGAPGVGIVLSPAVALDDPDLPDGELEFAQLHGTLIESTVWMGATRAPGVRASATLLPSGEHLERRGAVVELAIGPVAGFVVEVVPAAVRARLHPSIGAEIDAHRIAARRALLTTSNRPPDSPWYRARRVETVLSTRPKDIRHWLRGAVDAPLEIATHGLSVVPDQLWRAIGRPPRGPRGRRLDLVRTDTGAIAIVSTWED